MPSPLRLPPTGSWSCGPCPRQDAGWLARALCSASTDRWARRSRRPSVGGTAAPFVVRALTCTWCSGRRAGVRPATRRRAGPAARRARRGTERVDVACCCGRARRCPFCARRVGMRSRRCERYERARGCAPCSMPPTVSWGPATRRSSSWTTARRSWAASTRQAWRATALITRGTPGACPAAGTTAAAPLRGPAVGDVAKHVRMRWHASWAKTCPRCRRFRPSA